MSVLYSVHHRQVLKTEELQFVLKVLNCIRSSKPEKYVCSLASEITYLH